MPTNKLNLLSEYAFDFPIQPPGRNPCDAVSDVTKQFNRFTEDFLDADNEVCSGRIKEVTFYRTKNQISLTHQFKLKARMDNWKRILQWRSDCKSYQYLGLVRSWKFTRINAWLDVIDVIERPCYFSIRHPRIRKTFADCEKFSLKSNEQHFQDNGRYYKINDLCNPDFVDPMNRNCTTYDVDKLCYNTPSGWLSMTNAVSTRHGYEFGLNCPECGCTDAPISLYDLWSLRAVMVWKVFKPESFKSKIYSTL